MTTPHASTSAVLAECDSPSVQSAGDIKEAIKAFRTALHASGAQTAVLQGLIGIASMDETHIGIKQQYTGLEEVCRSAQTKNGRVSEYLVGFLNSLDSLAESKQLLQDQVTAAGEE